MKTEEQVRKLLQNINRSQLNPTGITEKEWLDILSHYPVYFARIPPFEQTEAIADIAVTSLAINIVYLSGELKTAERMEKAMAADPDAFKYISEKLITPNIAFMAISHDEDNLGKLPKRLRTQELIIEALKGSYSVINDIDADEQTPEIALFLAKGNHPHKVKLKLDDANKANFRGFGKAPARVVFQLRHDLLTDEVLGWACSNAHDDYEDLDADNIIRGLRWAFANKIAEPEVTDFDPAALLYKATCFDPRLRKRYETMMHLRNTNPKEVVPYVKTEGHVSVFRVVYGTKLALQMLDEPKRARQWLSEELGL